MPAKNFQQLDLNLLRSFVILYQTQNTSKAAEILNLSQSAVSKILQRLRNHFADELFLRTPKGLTPTPLAKQLGKQLPELMDSLANICENQTPLSPAQFTGVIKISAIQPILEACCDEIYHQLSKQAPNVEIHIHHWSNDTKEQLLAGDIDIGLHYAPLDFPKMITQKVITPENFIILTRHDHPLQNKGFSIAEFVKYPNVTNIIPEYNTYYTNVEKICEQHNYDITMALRSSQLSNLANVIANSDHVMAATELCACVYKDKWKAIQSDEYKNLGIAPISVALYHHARNRTDPKFSWLTSVINTAVLKIKQS